MRQCVVCDIARGHERGHLVLETANILCFLDHRPINPGHLLICPREHHPDLTDLPDAVLTEVFQTARRMADHLQRTLRCDGVSLLQNNGRFNDLGHFHLHVFPRFVGDGFSWNAANGGIVDAGSLASMRSLLGVPA